MMALAVFVLVLGAVLMWGACEVRASFDAAARARRDAADLARARLIQPVQFRPAPAVLGWYAAEPLKAPRRTLRPSDLKREPVTLSDVPPEVIRLKRRREELAERQRKQAQEQARFMDVFKLTQEDYDFQPGA